MNAPESAREVPTPRTMAMTDLVPDGCLPAIWNYDKAVLLCGQLERENAALTAESAKIMEALGYGVDDEAWRPGESATDAIIRHRSELAAHLRWALAKLDIEDVRESDEWGKSGLLYSATAEYQAARAMVPKEAR